MWGWFGPLSLADDGAPPPARSAACPNWTLKPPAQPPKPALQLLGIMATFADSWFLPAWLHRHHALFERLVLVDASTDPLQLQLSRRVCQQYTVCRHLQQGTLTSTTDQTVRAIAMQALGEPVGRWILIAHADEFYVQDPRTVAAEADAMGVNAIDFRPMLAMPTPEEYSAIRARQWHVEVAQAADARARFSPESGEPLLAHTPATVAFEPLKWLQHHVASYTFLEARLFKWGKGMRWGTKHSLVTPEFFPNKKVDPALTGFFVHFKVHDFGSGAVLNCSYDPVKSAALRTGSGGDSCKFARSTWSRIHWENASQGPQSYYASTNRKPHCVSAGIRAKCSAATQGKARLHCAVAWRPGAHF